MKHNSTRTQNTIGRAYWPAALMIGAIALAGTGQAQVVLSENFTGGASTTGFTIDSPGSDCAWLYAPGGLDANNFNQDFGGALPSGGGFDNDFAFIDADECGASGVVVNTFLVSPPFDASAPGNYILSFSQQFRSLNESFARVEVFNGTSWTQVANQTTDVGYPNPAASTNINITAATGGSAVAQVRFQFSAAWDWWWAVDNIVVENYACAAPADLAVTGITTSGGTIGWTDNGSAGYEWVVTTGADPDGTNDVASGDGSNLTISGLNSGTPYTAWVRADCGDGSFSSWSNGFPFTTIITNDECSGAVALTVNPDFNCTYVTPGTITGATDSGTSSDCGGTADDDVWFSFVATDTLHRISLENITGSTSDLYMALWTGDCGSMTVVPNGCSDPESMEVGGLQIGTTYYLQVFSWTDTPGQTSAFDVCVGTIPFCQPPQSLALDSINSPNAWVSWSNNGAMEYQYELRVNGVPGSGSGGLVVEGTVADTVLNLTGLVPDSLYILYVRSICSPGDTSAWGEGLIIFDGYCNTIDFTSDVEPICNVTFAGINHDSPPDVDASPALENFLAFTAFVGQGGSYPITVSGNTNGDYTTYVTAFFDWDQNQTFETAVPIGSFTNTVCGTPITATVNVPADALIGTTRMRVVKNYDTAPTDPCGIYSFGQAEDYTVEVGTVGVADLGTKPEVSVYPNPASTELFFNANNGKAVQVQVYDMVGHLALEQTSTGKLDIAKLAPGSYTVQITKLDGTGVAHARFVKQ